MIRRHYIPLYSPAWHAFRSRGYGASEVAGVLAQYFPKLAEFVWSDPIKIHLDKIGEPIQQFNGNVSSLAGQDAEPTIIDKYRYWDNDNPSAEDMYRRRLAKGKKFNKVISPKCYITNDKYPWLFYSPDGLEYVNGVWVGNIEAKNSNSLECNRYPNRVSPAFIVQVLTGLLVSEREYSKLCIQIDGSWYEVITTYPSQKQFDIILDCTKQSWDKVQLGRQVKDTFGIDAYYGLNPDIAPKSWTKAYDELGGKSPLGLLQSLEPEFSGSEQEYDFISEHFPPSTEFSERDGNQEEFELLMERKPWVEKKQEAESHILKIDTQLAKSMAGFHKINFDQGFYSRKPDKNGTVRPYVSPKIYQ